MKRKNITQGYYKTILPVLLIYFLLSHSILCLAEATIGPPSLKTIPTPEVQDLDEYVKDEEAAIRLGKALLWDMRVGSDGIQACASCHFHAGADNRTKNQLTPGLLGGDTIFGNNPFTGNIDYPQFGPNYTVKPEDFPFHKLADPDDPNSEVIADTNDAFSSQGVFLTQFVNIIPNFSREWGIPLDDKVFHVKGETIRRVEPRNTPTMINALFNYTNFWDGRANNVFNGVNPFGAADQKAKVFVNDNGTFKQVPVRLENSSLASQAVGPPLSDFEMSFQGRTLPNIGKKMLALRPLGKQMVHPNDSVLGSLSRAKVVFREKLIGLPGLSTSYSDMIKEAFHDEYWNSGEIIGYNDDEGEWEQIPSSPHKRLLSHILPISRKSKGQQYTQMEANFSLFFGIAVQLYESTLRADDTLYDQYKEGTATLTPEQYTGLEIFMGKGKCINCHGGSEFTNASVSNAENELVEAMIMGDGNYAFYDNGFYNISVRPTGEDIGRGGLDPFGFPLSFSRLAFAKEECVNPMVGLVPALMGDFRDFIPELPAPKCGLQRVAVNGAFKTSGLRNIELTGPYLHNGGLATLRQVVDFYDRGGDFPKLNIENLDPDIQELGLTEVEKNNLVAFLLTLTDERVKYERAPFDHPQLFIPDGEIGNEEYVIGNRELIKQLGFSSCDNIREIPAVGKDGRSKPLPTFLDLDPYQP